MTPRSHTKSKFPTWRYTMRGCEICSTLKGTWNLLLSPKINAKWIFSGWKSNPSRTCLWFALKDFFLDLVIRCVFLHLLVQWKMILFSLFIFQWKTQSESERTQHFGSVCRWTVNTSRIVIPGMNHGHFRSLVLVIASRCFFFIMAFYKNIILHWYLLCGYCIQCLFVRLFKSKLYSDITFSFTLTFITKKRYLFHKVRITLYFPSRILMR